MVSGKENNQNFDPIILSARERFKIDYLFPYQRLVISNILEAAAATVNPEQGERGDANPHQIVILPTGAGKSLCFMLPALLLPGATLVVFPLLSLIADQARRLLEEGIEAGILRGGQDKAERDYVFDGVKSGRIKVLLSNPETVLTRDIIEKIKQLDITHLVIDETHTVSEWGESFRPSYLEIGRVAKEGEVPVVTAFTATASPYILERVKEILFPDTSPNVVIANPDRPNISYRVEPCLSKNHQLIMLLGKSTRNRVKRPAIVFCRSRTGAELTAQMLRSRLNEKEIYFYHAGLTREEKGKIEKWFFNSPDGVLCATCAYGMGVDKRNVRTVIHRDLPPSVESYLQESGRGGRDREPSEAILLFSNEDREYLKEIKEPFSRSRYKAMLGYAESSHNCRREHLLSLLDAEPEVCFGCDFCKGELRLTPQGKEAILKFFSANKRRYAVREAKNALKGSKGYEAYRKELHLAHGFGALADWEIEDIEESLEMLIHEKVLKRPSRGFWKNRITI